MPSINFWCYYMERKRNLNGLNTMRSGIPDTHRRVCWYNYRCELIELDSIHLTTNGRIKTLCNLYNKICNKKKVEGNTKWCEHHNCNKVSFALLMMKAWNENFDIVIIGLQASCHKLWYWSWEIYNSYFFLFTSLQKQIYTLTNTFLLSNYHHWIT